MTLPTDRRKSGKFEPGTATVEVNVGPCRTENFLMVYIVSYPTLANPHLMTDSSFIF